MTTKEKIEKMIGAQSYVACPPIIWVGVPGISCMMVTKKCVKMMLEDESYRDATAEEIRKLDHFMNGGKQEAGRVVKDL